MGARWHPWRRIRSGCTWTQDAWETASGCGHHRTVPDPGSAAIWTLHLLPGHTVEKSRHVVSMVQSTHQDINRRTFELDMSFRRWLSSYGE